MLAGAVPVSVVVYEPQDILYFSMFIAQHARADASAGGMRHTETCRRLQFRRDLCSIWMSGIVFWRDAYADRPDSDFRAQSLPR